MTKQIQKFLITALFFTIVPHAQAQEGQADHDFGSVTPGYHYLICRGGGSMSPIIQPLEQSTQIIVNFKAANSDWQKKPSLNPGECTWVDRKLSEEEPTSIKFDIPADIEQIRTWSPNAKAFFFPFQQPVNMRTTKKISRAAIKVRAMGSGFSLEILRPQTGRPSRSGEGRSGRAYELMTSFDFSAGEYLTFSVKSENGSFQANRLIKGAVTGKTINVDDGGKVEVRQATRDRN